MRAVVIEGQGGPEVLSLQEVPDPSPGPHEILVRVSASGLNRADLLQCRGLYPAPPGVPADIPGLEYAGVVEAKGDKVTRWSEGDRVMGIVGGGAAAERLVTHEAEALPIPGNLSDTDAAAIPEAFMTAFDAAVLQGGLGQGDWVALNATASGVGTALIQIARYLGAHSVGASRTPSKLAQAEALGLDVAVCGESEALMEAAKKASGGQGVAVVVDLVGGKGLGTLVQALRPRGALILVGLLGGARTELALAPVLTRRLRIQGSVLRSRGHDEKRRLREAFEAQLITGFEGTRPPLTAVIDRVVPWSEVADAHRALMSNETTGKIVLSHRD